MSLKEKVSRALGLLGIFGVANLFLYPFQEEAIFPIDEVPSRDIIAPYDFPIPKDSIQLEAERRRAEASVLPVLVLDLNRLGTTRRQIAELRTNPAQFLTTHPLLISNQTRAQLDSPQAAALLRRIEVTLSQILAQGYWEGKPDWADTQRVVIKAGDEEIEERLTHLLGPSEVDSLFKAEAQRLYPNADELRSAFYQTARMLLKPNLLYDSVATTERREEARSQVSPNQGWVLRGELIASAGHPLTSEARKKLESLHSTQRMKGPTKGRWLLSGNLLLLSFLTVGFCFLWFQDRARLKESGSLYLILTLFGVGLGLSRLAGVWYWELSPVALTGIAATILLDLEVAWVLVAGLALMIGFRAGFSIYLFLGLGLGGVLAALIARRIHSWSQLYYCLFGVLLGNGIGFGISWLLDPKFGAGWLNGLGLSLLNGFASTLIAGLLISRSEEWFGVVNPLGIGRFLDLNHPLLQKLALEAPGSYQHSVVVGNLAEAGARAIGANPILAKVGGYFHDLGKLRKPQYFMENQAGADNPHDHLSPQLSALIITAHVRDGLEFARKLPRPIQEVIAQHHGTTTMELLYHKARRRRPTPTKYEYRYPGPKPSFREAALVMLADGVEAAARAEPRASAQHMRKLIKELVEARYEDGQLDESGLSRTDLLKIQEAFYSIILSIFHPRAQYPRP